MRWRKVTICARVTVPSGPNRPSPTPVVIPFVKAQPIDRSASCPAGTSSKNSDPVPAVRDDHACDSTVV